MTRNAFGTLGRSAGGQDTFLPNSPSLEDVLNLEKKGLLGAGFSALNNTQAGKHLAEAAEKPENDLLRRYARLFNGNGNSDDADAVVNDLLGMTLRKGMFIPQAGMTQEQYMPYFLERYGQNGLMIYMLYMIAKGQALPAPGAARTRKKSKR